MRKAHALPAFQLRSHTLFQEKVVCFLETAVQSEASPVGAADRSCTANALRFLGGEAAAGAHWVCVRDGGVHRDTHRVNLQRHDDTSSSGSQLL